MTIANPACYVGNASLPFAPILGRARHMSDASLTHRRHL